MNRTPLDDCQLETIDPIKARFHRIALAVLFTGVLYFNVEPNQKQVTRSVSPLENTPILTTPIKQVALSDTSTSNKLSLPNQCESGQTSETLPVRCRTPERKLLN
jgi:hypothetical protein